MLGLDEQAHVQAVFGTLDPSWAIADDAFSTETEAIVAAMFDADI